MSNDTQESLGSTRPRLIHPSVLTQMQIERLKREDEEEHWISGEELCTEGSSDDDDDRRLIGGAVDPELIRHADSIRSNYCRHPAAGRSSRWGGSGHRSQIRDRQEVKADETDSGTSASAVKPVEEEPEAASSLPSTGFGAEKNPTKSSGAGDHEISWRPKRDDSNCETILRLDNSSAIVELRELQFEYGDILDSISELKTSLTPLNRSWNSDDSRRWDTGNNCENEIDVRAVNGAGIIIEDDGVSFNDELDRWSEAVINTDKIEKEISKVAKLDACIEEIDDEVKKARGGTRREQILNREKLKKMQSRGAPEAGQLAKNSIRFFELCNSKDADSTAAELGEGMDVHPVYPAAGSADLNIGSGDEEEGLEESESRESHREKLQERLTQIEKRKASFIERNKELASCAMGTLAITDEEKKRLEELLEDVDDEECGSDRESATSFSTVVSTPYTIDKEADELLKELTEQLSNINSETYRKSAEEAEEEFLRREKIVLSSLRDLAESGSKAIYPISEEEVRRLISEYHAEQEAGEFSKDFEPLELSCSNSFSTIGGTPRIARNVIEELIKEAKTTMPLFQFKYRTEEPQCEDQSEKKSA